MESFSDDCSQQDTKLFLLALLMSSMLIYNSKSVLNSETIKKLGIVAKIGEKIKSKRSKYAQVNSLFKATADFVWVVRDFGLIQNETGTSKLRSFLVPEKFIPNERLGSEANAKKREEIDLKNKINESITNTFDHTVCFYLPLPVSDGKILNTSFF